MLAPLLVGGLAACSAGRNEGAADSADTSTAPRAGGDASDPDTGSSEAIPDSLRTRVANAKLPRLGRRPQDDAAAWARFRQDLFIWRRTATTATRGCVDDPKDEEGTDCRLEIWPVEGSSQLDTLAIDTLGFVVARISNIGAKKEAFFGIDPKRSAYWRIYRRVDGGSTGARGRLASQFVDSASGRPIMRPTVESSHFTVPGEFGADEFPFRVCGHKPPGTPTGTWARFVSCDDAHAAGEKAIPDQPGQARKLRHKHNSPAWITCVQGCCAVEGP